MKMIWQTQALGVDKSQSQTFWYQVIKAHNFVSIL